MGYSNGHIYAPVSVSDVAAVLGKSSHDLGTLCMDKDINPYSLIRPLYSVTPDILPAHLVTGADYGEQPAGTADWGYTKGKWGFWVPVTGTPNNIRMIYDKPWVRRLPTIDTFKCLAQFDGYRHDVKPSLPVRVLINTGDYIRVMIDSTASSAKVLSDTGRNNPGGVVNISAVLSGRMFGSDTQDIYLGCTIYRNGNLAGHYVSDRKADETADENTEVHFTEIMTDFRAQSGDRYTIYPWAANKRFEPKGSFPAGLLIYGLMFSEQFAGFMEYTAPNYSVALGAPELDRNAWTIAIKVSNSYPNDAITVSDFRLHARYRHEGEIRQEDIQLTGGVPVTVPKGGSVMLNLSINRFSNLTSGAAEFMSGYVTARYTPPGGTMQTIQSIDILSDNLTNPEM